MTTLAPSNVAATLPSILPAIPQVEAWRTGDRVTAIAHYTQQKSRQAFRTLDAPAGMPKTARTAWNARRRTLTDRHTQRPQLTRVRRVSRARETAPATVAWAIPHGSNKAKHTAETWRSLMDHPEFARMNRQHRRSLARVLWVLIRCVDFESMTTRPGWQTIQERAQVSRSTCARHVATLHRLGLLGTVAHGRSAAYVPGRTENTGNEAAVYVLCASSTPVGANAGERPSPRAVGKDETPPPVGGFSSPVGTPHTRTREATPDVEPLRGPESSRRGASAAQPHHPATAGHTLYPAHKTLRASRTLLAAAAEQLRTSVPTLRALSTRDVRHLIRPFASAGWTLADVLRALDYRPEAAGPCHTEAWGLSLPTPAADERSGAYARRLRGAVRTRLAAWTRDGQVMRSPDQRAAAEATERRARAQAARERAEQRQRQTAENPHISEHGRRKLAEMRAGIAKSRQEQRYKATR